MKKLILAAALLVAGPAYAGDMPRYNNAPQVYQNLFNWTGFYAGLNTGLGWGDANGSDVSGYAIGGQIGYNYQLVSGLVFGAETDITITGIDGATASGFSLRITSARCVADSVMHSIAYCSTPQVALLMLAAIFTLPVCRTTRPIMATHSVSALKV